MKKFRVVETRPATSYWVYEVEAENEDQAKKAVEDLPTKQIVLDHFTEVDWDADADFEYQEI